MKRLVLAMFMAIGGAAFADCEYVEVRGAASGFEGRIVAVDIQSTKEDAAVDVRQVRNIESYTNGIEIVGREVTNKVYFTEEDGKMGVSNAVYVIEITNAVKLLEARQCVTNTIVSINCVNGFCTADVSRMIFVDDLILVDTDDPVKATVVIEK